MFGSLKRFKEFDKVTEFRLYNAFVVALGFGLLSPILISLKGMYLLPWIISVFAIMQTLSVKANNWMVNNISLDTMYKLGIIIHILFVFISGIYFFSPELMIWLDGTLAIIEVALFSSYSIALNNYLTDNFPKDMKNFQIVRNSIWADGYLLGLLIITIITYFSTIGVGILAFMIFNTMLSLWLLSNWNFFKAVEI